MNSEKDIKSYFDFLSIDLYPSPRLMHENALFQKKDLLNLLEKKENRVQLELTIKEKEYFLEMYNVCLLKLQNTQEMMKIVVDKRLKNMLMSCLLVQILRLRQSCNFLKVYQVDDGKKTIKEIPFEEQCFICYSKYATHESTCKHKFCLECWTKVINISHSCPICRSNVTLSGLTEFRKCEITIPKEMYISPKLKYLLTLINNHSDSKIIISSQWTQTLEIVEKFLNKKGISTLKLIGGMNNTQKYETIEKYKSTETPVLLTSLTSCAEGLNLTEVNVVIHFERWWNEQKTDQMSDRVYRIGQEKKVYVYYLEIKESIEDVMIKINAIKKNISNEYIYTTKEKLDNNFSTIGYLSVWLKKTIENLK
jgi:SNF2 family DNA or RNA helicase